MWTALLVLALLVSNVRAEDACMLEPDPGPCKQGLTRYFYNPRTRSCESFTYGGCQGVVPFETMRQCERARCNPCVQKPRTGPCDSRLKRFFFNNRSGRCEAFLWGGCDGTVPFESLRDCQMMECEPVERTRSARRPLATRCDIEPDAGPCLDDKRRWYFDSTSQTCKSFRYGGCFGRVPFRRRRQCERANCGESNTAIGDDAEDEGDADDAEDEGETKDDLCSATPDPGPCKGSFPRWFYNPDTDACESFTYGGCRGSAPFATRTECEASNCIRNRCTLEPERGPCDGDETKYFFNEATGECESFSYGGCFGVVPYNTLRQCERASCANNRCGLRPERGPCERNMTRWWYDPSSGKCTSFMWGGCGGTVPYETRRECRRAGCERDPCRLVPETGICRAFFLRWFWNQEFRRCESFIWGGCGGVVPFLTEMECEDALCAGANFGNNDNSFSMA